MADTKTMNWIDLSAYGVRLCVVVVPKGETNQKLLALAPGPEGEVDNQIQNLTDIGSALGFTRIDKTPPIFVNPNVSKFKISEMQAQLQDAGFDQSTIAEVPQASVFRTPNTPAPAQQSAPAPAQDSAATGAEPAPASSPQPAAADATGTLEDKQDKAAERRVLMNLSTSLGYNRQERQVFEFYDGERTGERFQLGADLSDPIFENGETGRDAGDFLRAPDDAALKECAATIAEQINHGEVVRLRDLETFATTIFGNDYSDEQFASLVNGVDNYFSGWVRGHSDRSYNQMYSDAVRISENSAYKGMLSGDTDSLASINLPLSVVVARIANGLSNDDTKATFVNPGHGNLFAKWKKGKNAQLNVVESRQDVASSIAEYSREIGLRQDDEITVGTPNYDGSDVIVANIISGWSDAPQYRLNTEYNRHEFVEIVDALDKREPEGHAVFTFKLSRDEDVMAEYEDFLAELGRFYTVEGIAEIDGTVHSGVAGIDPIVTLSVGPKRPVALQEAHEASQRRKEIFDSASLFTWSSEVLKSRSKIENYIGSLDQRETVEGFRTADGERNEFQSPYVSASKVGEPEAMSPKHLEAPMRQAMAKMLRYHPDPDEYVANSIGFTKEQLARHYSPEQVDVMAMEAFAEEQGKPAFQIGDQTGIGKGREGAGIIARHVLLGRTCWWMTAKKANIDDILRDLGDAGVLDYVQPLILNGGTYYYKDKETGEVREYEGLTKERIFEELVDVEEEVIDVLDEDGEPTFDEDGERITETKQHFSSNMPEGFNLVLGTYSQVSGDLEKLAEEEPDGIKAAKLRFFKEQIDENSVLVFDEAQKATGKSNTGNNMRAAIENAYRTVFMSATHAKNVDTMGLYNILFPDYLDEETIHDILAKGGENAQEVISSMLAQNGVLMRREHDNSRLTFETIEDIERYDRNRAIVDAISPILSEIAFLSGDVNRRIQNVLDEEADNLEAREMEAEEARLLGNADQRREANRNVRQARSKVKGLQASKLSFGSPLFQITKTVVAAAKSDAIASFAVEDILQGRKPVVMADGTQGAVYKQCYDLQIAEGLEEARAPDIKDLMHRQIDMIFAKLGQNEATQVEYDPEQENENENEEDEVDPELLRRLETIRGMVDQIDDFPISMIDAVKNAIRDAGFSCGEMTGRAHEYDGTKVVPRVKVPASIVVDRFNNGDYDAVIVNKSNLEGISLHDAPHFVNHGQRVLYEGDMPGDINDRIQGHGRINRKGSMTDALIRAIATGIPAEQRLLASSNQKMRQLSANVSSNRDNKSLIANVLDVYNVVGDKVCETYFETHPDTLRMLGFEDDFAEGQANQNAADDLEGEVKESKRTANQIFARMMLLTCDFQEHIMGEIDAEYEAEIMELDATNSNPLKPAEIPGIVRTRKKELFEGPEEGTILADAFEEPVFMETAIVETLEDPLSGNDVDNLVSQATRNGEGRFANRQSDKIDHERGDRLNGILRMRGGGHASVEEAVAAGNNHVATISRQMDRLQTVIQNVVPGSEIRLNDAHGEPVMGIVTSVRYPSEKKPAYSAANYRFQYVTPGDAEPRPSTFDALMSNRAFWADEAQMEPHVWAGLNDAKDERVDMTLRQFDNASEFKRQEEVRLLTGNVFRAMQISQENNNIGTMCVYEDGDEGIMKRGMVLKKDALTNRVAEIPVALRTPEMTFDYLRDHEGATIYPDQKRAKRSMTIKHLTQGYQVTMPSPKAAHLGKIYKNENIREMYDNARADVQNGARQLVRVNLDEDALLDFLRDTMGTGIRFWVSSNNRAWANDWSTRMNIAEADEYGIDQQELEAEAQKAFEAA